MDFFSVYHYELNRWVLDDDYKYRNYLSSVRKERRNRKDFNKDLDCGQILEDISLLFEFDETDIGGEVNDMNMDSIA